MLTHANLKANIDQMRQVPIAIGPDDVALCVLPLFHIFGLNVVLNLAIEVGAKVVLSERFDPAGSLDLIKAHLVTMIAGAPPVYVAWLLGDAPRGRVLEPARRGVRRGAAARRRCCPASRTGST